MQCPDELDKSVGRDVDFDKSYGWLIQLADGNRIDLHVEPTWDCHVTDDKLCKILLDKDGILPKIPEATDEDYRVKKPTAAEFLVVHEQRGKGTLAGGSSLCPRYDKRVGAFRPCESFVMAYRL